MRTNSSLLWQTVHRRAGQVLKSVSAPGRWRESYRFRIGAKVFNVTNHFNPRDYQGNLASGEFGGFYNGVGRRFGLKFVVEKK